MKNFSEVHIGSVHVHKKVLADIIAAALEGVEGVSLMPKGFFDSVAELAGYSGYPGVEIHIDDNNDVTIGLKVHVRYSMNISDIARQIQDVIRSALDKMVDIHVKDVNISIQGIERGEQ